MKKFIPPMPLAQTKVRQKKGTSQPASITDTILTIMSLSTTALEVIRMLELDDHNAEIVLDRLIEEIASVTGRKLLKGR